MRNLTIKSEKTFIGWFGEPVIYVCDEVSGNVKINEDLCRRLGQVKNGGESTFVIGEEETKIYAVSDKYFKKASNDFVVIPAGTEDVVLEGRNVFHAFIASLFRFNGVTDSASLENRKKVRKKAYAHLLRSCISGCIIGVVLLDLMFTTPLEGKPVTVVESGVKMTISDGFEKSKTETAEFRYSWFFANVFGSKYSFDDEEALKDLTVEEFAEKRKKKINENAQIKSENGLVFLENYTYSEHTKSDDKWIHVFYKTSDLFWMISFVTAEFYVDKYEPLFFEWAKSVEFVEE